MIKQHFHSDVGNITFATQGSVSITETTEGQPAFAINTTPDGENISQTLYFGHDDITIHASGTSRLTIGVEPPTGFAPAANYAVLQSATIDLAAHGNLITTDLMAFGRLTVNGAHATETLSGTSYFAGTDAVLKTHLTGTGELVLQPLVAFSPSTVQDAKALINGRVDEGVTVRLQGNLNHAATGGASLTLAKPTEFAGTIEVGPGSSFVDLLGLHADSYSMKGDLLSLFSGDRLVDMLKLANLNNEGGPVGLPLTVEHNAHGILIATTGEDRYETGGVGTPLKIHS